MASGTTNQQVGLNNANSNAVVAGARALTNITSTRKVPQVLKTVQINKNRAPCYFLAKKIGIKETVEQEAFYWFEEDGLPMTVTTTAAEYAAGDVTINVASGHGKRVRAGMNLLCRRTGEMIHVVSVSTDALTVTRAVTTTPAAAIIATGGTAEELQIMAPNEIEGSTAPEGKSVEPARITNVTQTMRAAYEGSDRLIKSQNYGTPEWQRMEQDTMNQLMDLTEIAFLFNQGSKTTDSAHSAGGGTISQGIEAFITDNLFASAGTCSVTDLNTWMLTWVRMNNNTRDDLILWGGDGLSRLIDSEARDNLRYSTDNRFLGMEVQEFRSSQGQIKFKFHPVFTPAYSSVTAANVGWVGQAIGLNMSNVGIATFKGRGLKRETDLEAISTDGKKAGLKQDIGFICKNQRTHINVTGILN